MGEILFETGTRDYQIEVQNHTDDVFCVDEEVLQELRKMKCQRIVFLDTEKRQEWVTQFYDWMEAEKKNKQRLLEKKGLKHYHLI